MLKYFFLLTCYVIVVQSQIYQRHKHHNASMESLLYVLKAATFTAEVATKDNPNYGQNNHTIFYSQGNIYDVEDQVKYYSHVANLPGVNVICETGFNAGHSAITFLFSNRNATYIGFDLADNPVY